MNFNRPSEIIQRSNRNWFDNNNIYSIKSTSAIWVNFKIKFSKKIKNEKKEERE